MIAVSVSGKSLKFQLHWLLEVMKKNFLNQCLYSLYIFQIKFNTLLPITGED